MIKLNKNPILVKAIDGKSFLVSEVKIFFLIGIFQKTQKSIFQKIAILKENLKCKKFPPDFPLDTKIQLTDPW